jgi:ABC-type uncharacterized transport system substrate-binding protein
MQFGRTNRREFITLLGGAGAAWPLATRAQQPAMPVIGFLHSGSAQQNAERLDAYRRGLGEGGFIEGQNVAIEFRWAAGQNDKLPALAADLIQRHVTVIATPGSTPAAVAAKAATSTIPIVFAVGADPVELGLVTSLNHPGGNATGITSMNADIAAKRFELIRELVPQAASYFGLVNPASPLAQPMAKALEAGAATVGIALKILRARSNAEIDAVMGRLQSTANVMVSGTDALFFVRRAHIAALALRQALPTIFALTSRPNQSLQVEFGAIDAFPASRHAILLARCASSSDAPAVRESLTEGLHRHRTKREHSSFQVKPVSWKSELKLRYMPTTRVSLGE